MPPTISARLSGHITLEARADGSIAACFDGHSVDLGKFSAGAVTNAQHLRTGLPLTSFASDGGTVDKEIDLLVRRLARRGLLEYRLGRSRKGDDLVVIEPQLPDYWPRMRPLRNVDTVVLSRFAYMRRRGNEMVLESPRAGAVFRICDPKIGTTLALLSTPQQIKQLRRRDSFPGVELLALLVDCKILFKTEAATDSGLRPTEGDDNLVLWDFHDLLFHARSTQGRHANPLGGLYPYAGLISPLPAIRPRWPGKKIDLRKFSAAHSAAISPIAMLFRERHSTRTFDDQRPITLAELARFLAVLLAQFLHPFRGLLLLFFLGCWRCIPDADYNFLGLRIVLLLLGCRRLTDCLLLLLNFFLFLLVNSGVFCQYSHLLPL